jgi:hypothetical protein
MRYVFACILSWLALSCQVANADGVYVANLMYEKLVPPWPNSCNQNMGAPDAPAKVHPDGIEEVCISTQCGWSEAALKPVETLAGKKRVRTFKYRQQLGIYCKPLTFPEVWPVLPVLVDEQSERMTFHQLYQTVGGELGLPPNPNVKVHGIPLSRIDPTGRAEEYVRVAFGVTARMTAEQVASARNNPNLTERGDSFWFTNLITISDLKAALAANNSSQRP